MGRAASTGVRGRTARAAGGLEWRRVRDTMGGVYWGPGAGIVSWGGSGADPLLGRLRWGGAARPRRSPRARLRRGPGRRRGRWVAKAGLTSGFAAVATTAPPLWRKLPPTLGPRVRPEETAETEAHEGSGRVGPVASGSGRAAAAHPPPCQRDSARPGQAQLPPHPVQRARVGPPPQPVPRLPLPPTLKVLAGLCAATIHRRPVLGRLQPARPRPRARGPAPRDSPAADQQARALTSHAPYRLPESAART